MKSSIQNLFLMLALFAGSCQAISQDFVISSSPSVGGYPDSVVAADVNGDGKLDLISANYAGTLTVLTNNGAGGFILSSNYRLAGSLISSVTTADVNGDNKLDLTCVNNDVSDSSLIVLTNNGSGGFVFSATYHVGGAPNSVVAADVNGDGKIDLISANTAANTLTVLTNNGSGGFALSSSPTVGVSPQCVVAADVNGDGKIDLISANYGGNTLTVLTNNGQRQLCDILFAQRARWSSNHCGGRCQRRWENRFDQRKPH